MRSLQARVVKCTRCPELRAYCREVARVGKREFAGETYWARPVPGNGKASSRVLIVGLAPAAHGANRTGRMFTGASSGAWLSRAMYGAGFATAPFSVRRGDGFAPVDAFVTAALRCAPPGTKPNPAQLERCSSYLRSEVELLRDLRVVIGLGAVGYRAAARALADVGYRPRAGARPAFAHGAELAMDGPPGREPTVLVASYHPSRQNTNTGVLTRAMLDAIFRRARRIVDGESRRSRP